MVLLTPHGTGAALHVLRWSGSVGELAWSVPAAALTLRNASLIWLLALRAVYWLLRPPADPIVQFQRQNQASATVVTAQGHTQTVTCPASAS